MIFTDRAAGDLWTMESLSATVVEDKQVLFPSGVEERKLYIVSGESGSGKTTFGLMTAELGICLTPKDVKESLAVKLLPTDEERNERVFSSVTGAVATILNGLFADRFDELSAGLP